MRTKLFTIIAATLLCLTACASGTDLADELEGESTVITADELLATLDYDLNAYVLLPTDYEDNFIPEIDEAEYTLNDDDVIMYIEEYLLAYNPQYTKLDKDVIEDGDTVNIDYVGTVDGEEIDGGSDTDYYLTIGSGTFIDGFEDGLIGKNVGDTVELNLTFPETYSEESLAGKDAIFTVTIHDIYDEKFLTYDTLTEEYVQTLFSDNDDVNTIQDLWDTTEDYLKEELEDAKVIEIQEQLTDYLIENSTFNYPDSAIENVEEELINSVETEAEAMDMSYEEYIEGFFGYDDMDDFNEYLHETAETSLRQELVANTVLEERQTSITEEEFEEFMQSYMEYYGFSSLEEVYEFYGDEDYVKLTYAASKAMEDAALEIAARS